MDELESESLLITLYDTSKLIKKASSSKVVSLRGIVDSQTIFTEMYMTNPKTNNKYFVKVQGSANIPSIPKYRQHGDNVVLKSTCKYLCIKVLRVENIRPAENRGIVDSLVSVSWCGPDQRTRIVYENNNPTFNEILYFPVLLPQNYIDDPEKYVMQINEEFLSKNEVSFNLMILGDDNTYDNFGIAYFHLSDLKSGEKQQRQYFADDLKKDVKYMSRIYSGKSKFESAFSLSNITKITYEAWFITDFPPLIDFGEKKKKSERGDKIPIQLEQYFKFGKDLFQEDFIRIIPNVFKKYTNMPYRERLFLQIYQVDQYNSTHLLPYYLSPISFERKEFSIDDIIKNPNFFDYNLETLDEIAHYTRCFIFSNDKNDIWMSPDNMLKNKKGNLQDHAIFMASLMMGLKKTKSNRVKYYEVANNLYENKESDSGTKTKGFDNLNNYQVTNNNTSKNGMNTSVNTTKNSINTKNFDKNKILEEKNIFPFENRTFVCLGKLKHTKAPYAWVMTFSDDYKDVTLWDPKLFTKFELKGRVDDTIKLKNFLNGVFPDYNSVKRGNIENIPEQDESLEEPEKKPPRKKDIDEINLRGLRDDSRLEYDEGEDLYRDTQMNEKEHLLVEWDVVAKNEQEDDGHIKFKYINPKSVDDQLTYEKTNNKNKYSFIEEQQKELEDLMQDESGVSFTPIDTFTDINGKVVVDKFSLPYESIDLIFNRNNIYANIQYHDPIFIKYNIYDKKSWMPYIRLKAEKIWRGKFEQFYQMPNFGSPYSPGMVNKMKESLIKEVRVGIMAARSGMNLPTKFKKKNEDINSTLQKYCDLAEDLTLNRITQKEYQNKISELQIMIKKKIPKFYKMEAKMIFFNFFETEIIRREINDDLESFYNTKIKNLMFATYAKVYPYINRILSIRIILAKFYKIPLDDITDPIEEKEYKELLKVDPLKLGEEEQDSEEEEENKEFIETNEKNTDKDVKNNNSKQITTVPNVENRGDNSQFETNNGLIE